MGEISDYMPETVKEINEIPEGYVASSDYPLPMPEWDRRKRKGLERIFSKGPFLKDQNLDELPDMMDVHIVLPSDSSDVQFEAAVNVAFRLGMETTAFEGILLRQSPKQAMRSYLQEERISLFPMKKSRWNQSIHCRGWSETDIRSDDVL